MREYLPEPLVYGGFLNKHDDLIASSSGGAFTALSDVFLTEEGAITCSIYNYQRNSTFDLCCINLWTHKKPAVKKKFAFF